MGETVRVRLVHKGTEILSPFFFLLPYITYSLFDGQLTTLEVQLCGTASTVLFDQSTILSRFTSKPQSQQALAKTGSWTRMVQLHIIDSPPWSLLPINPMNRS
jgi:hypothetical protein